MTMNLDKLREIITEEVKKRTLREGMTKKDFIAMARLIKSSRTMDKPVLIDFAITFAKTQNINFDERRFRDAVQTGKGI